MLKCLDRLNGLEAASDGQAAAGAEQQQQYSVLDVTGEIAEVRCSSTGSAVESSYAEYLALCCCAWQFPARLLMPSKVQCKHIIRQGIYLCCWCVLQFKGSHSTQPSYVLLVADKHGCCHLLLVITCCAQVMNDEGDTQQLQLAVCDQELVDALRKAFQAEQEVMVQLGMRHGKPAIVKMSVQ
jgi:hypothetical protein